MNLANKVKNDLEDNVDGEIRPKIEGLEKLLKKLRTVTTYRSKKLLY